MLVGCLDALLGVVYRVYSSLATSTRHPDKQVTAQQPASGAQGCIELVVSEGVEVLLPLAGLFDAAKELARLTKQEAKLVKELSQLEGRLNNKSFVDKAPEAVVAEVREQAAELRGKLEAVQAKMQQLQ